MFLHFAGALVMGAAFLIAPPIYAEPPAFDVASVKPNNSNGRGMGFNFQPGGLTASNMPLQTLISIAYDLPLQSDRISGGPDWVRSELFDIEGKTQMPAGLPAIAREARLKLMLQTLLADRFKLSLQRETKQLPVYVVTVAKNGPKLQKAKVEEKDCAIAPEGPGSCHAINGGAGRGLHGKAVGLQDILLFASNWADRPLIDKTGLPGLFEIDTEGWTPMRARLPRPDGEATAEDVASADPTRATLAVIFGRLGLRMDPQKGPVEIFTIAHVEKPSAN